MQNQECTQLPRRAGDHGGDDGGHVGGGGDDGGEKEKDENEYGEVVITMDAPRLGEKDTRNSFEKLFSFRYKKKQKNKWPI